MAVVPPGHGVDHQALFRLAGVLAGQVEYRGARHLPRSRPWTAPAPPPPDHHDAHIPQNRRSGSGCRSCGAPDPPTAPDPCPPEPAAGYPPLLRVPWPCGCPGESAAGAHGPAPARCRVRHGRRSTGRWPRPAPPMCFSSTAHRLNGKPCARRVKNPRAHSST